MSLLSEFKEFAMKGNVVDMAVGIVIGAAFGKIVSAFVDATSSCRRSAGSSAAWTSRASRSRSARTRRPASRSPSSYGVFIQALVDFLIIAAAIFMALKAINRLKRPAPAAAAAAAAGRRACC